MTKNKSIIIDGVDVSECDVYSARREGYCGWCIPCEGALCSYKTGWLVNKLAEANKKLEDIAEIIAPFNILTKKVCENCTYYATGSGVCTKDLPQTTYTTSQTKACDAFCYTDDLVPNILANRIKDVLDNKQ